MTNDNLPRWEVQDSERYGWYYLPHVMAPNSTEAIDAEQERAIRLIELVPAMLEALKGAQGDACGGCGSCLLCRVLDAAQ